MLSECNGSQPQLGSCCPRSVALSGRHCFLLYPGILTALCTLVGKPWSLMQLGRFLLLLQQVWLSPGFLVLLGHTHGCFSTSCPATLCCPLLNDLIFHPTQASPLSLAARSSADPRLQAPPAHFLPTRWHRAHHCPTVPQHKAELVGTEDATPAQASYSWSCLRCRRASSRCFSL